MDNVTALTNTNFTKKHMDIAQEFIGKIVDILKAKDSEPTTYGTSNDAWQERESLKINVSENTTLEISRVTRK